MIYFLDMSKPFGKRNWNTDKLFEVRKYIESNDHLGYVRELARHHVPYEDIDWNVKFRFGRNMGEKNIERYLEGRGLTFRGGKVEKRGESNLLKESYKILETFRVNIIEMLDSGYNTRQIGDQLERQMGLRPEYLGKYIRERLKRKPGPGVQDMPSDEHDSPI